MSHTSFKKTVHIYHMAPLVTISNDALPGKYEKNYQNSAHGISWLSWLGWSGIFLCHSRLILQWIIFPWHSYVSYHIAMHWRIFLCHPRLIRRWPASADWHIDKSLGTNTLPTPPTLYSPVSSQLFECTEAYTKFIFSLNFRRRKNENSQSQERRRALCQQC